MPALFDLLNSLPAPAWAALATIIGAIIGAVTGIGGGLLGAFVTNRGHRHRLEKQLQHESIQRDREREMSLRREVYLKAAESIAEVHATIPQFLFMNIQEIQKSNSFVNLNKELNKLHIVGTVKTIRASVNYYDKLIGLLYYVLNEKIKIDISKSEIINIEKEIRLPQQNVEKINFLNNAKKQKELLIAENSIVIQKECTERMTIIQELLVESNLAIREEMNMKIDEQSYRNLMDYSRQAIHEKFNEFMESLSAHIQLVGK